MELLKLRLPEGMFPSRFRGSHVCFRPEADMCADQRDRRATSIYLDGAEADPLGKLFRAFLPFAIAINQVG